MKITRLFNSNNGRNGSRRVGVEAAQTLSVAAQIALLCPSGLDVWMQRELAGSTAPDPRHERLG